MEKDPAALLYIDKWFLATKEMKADCRGWFLNLILHQYDKKDLPEEIEELANLADVRISEFERFKQVWEEVLKPKFQQNDGGRLENPFAKDVIKSREQFKEKRGVAGKMSLFCKYVRKHLSDDENLIFLAKQQIDFEKVEIMDVNTIQHLFQQVLQQNGQQKGQQTGQQNLNYINVNVNTNNNEDKKGGVGEREELQHPATANMPQDVFIVPEMLSIWKKENPKYLVQRDKDFPALQKLAEVIAEQSKVKATDGAGFKVVKDTWTLIAQFVAKDAFYKSFSLFQVERHIQGISAKISASNEQTEKTTKSTQKHSTIQTNADAANKARQILQSRYAET